MPCRETGTDEHEEADKEVAKAISEDDHITCEHIGGETGKLSSKSERWKLRRNVVCFPSKEGSIVDLLGAGPFEHPLFTSLKVQDHLTFKTNLTPRNSTFGNQR